MYAIVDIAGQQFKVQKEQKLFVHRLEGEAGSKVSFDKVLLIDNDGKVTVGTPVIKDAAVSAKVIEHLKGDKVLVFKKKRRKGYRKLNGHRQQLTRIEITDILEKAAKSAAQKTTASGKASAADKPGEKKAAAPKATSATTKKEAAPKTSATKKPAAEKKETATKASSTKAATAKKPAAKKPAAKPKETAPKAATKKAAPKKETEAKKPAAKKADDDASAKKE